ncbi:MAG TPA: hypothetical protein VH436_32285 [Vicinamibacterales bacterium]|jgi:hypothetical protein
MEPIHEQVLSTANALAEPDGTFRIADVAAALPHLNPATVRTHVASRCCANAPAHHQSRYRYFRAVRRGVYRVEPAFRRRPRHHRGQSSSLDRILASLDSGVDATLIAASLAMTPTERIETMRQAALSLEALRRR